MDPFESLPRNTKQWILMLKFLIWYLMVCHVSHISRCIWLYVYMDRAVILYDVDGVTSRSSSLSLFFVFL